MSRGLGVILVLCAAAGSVCELGEPVARAQSAPRPASRQLLPSDLRVDDAKVTAQRKAALAWNMKILVGAYDRVGHRDPKWDEAARRGLTLTARLWAHDPDRPGDAPDQAWYALRTAITRGCDDPLVLYLNAEYSEADLPRLEAAHLVYAALLGLAPEPHHPHLVSRAMVESARTLSAASVGLSKEEWAPRWNSLIVIINRAFDLLPNVLADREMPAGQLVDHVNAMFDPWGRSGNDRQKMFPHVEAAFEKARDPKDPLLQVMRADALASSAWDVRGSGFARDVKPEAWPIFKQRLGQAEAEAAKALAMGANEYAIVRVMNRVALGLHGDADELDQWFRLGKRLAPGDRRPYWFRLYALEPRWLGTSVYEMFDFARRMQDEANWNLRLPLLMAEGHEDLTMVLADADKATYFANPLVCGDVLGTYPLFLQKYPDSGWERGAYIKWLARCGKWSDVKRELQLIPADRLRVGAFGGQSAYDDIRKRAASVP